MGHPELLTLDLKMLYINLSFATRTDDRQTDSPDECNRAQDRRNRYCFGLLMADLHRPHVDNLLLVGE